MAFSKLSWLLSFLWPQTLAVITSDINGPVSVQVSFGQIYVYAGQTQQSSPWVEKIWRRGISSLSTNTRSPRNGFGQKSIVNALILGLGCGLAAKLLSQKFPWLKIIGVEIDPVMIDITKEYFGLGDGRNLRIFKTDAQKFIRTNRSKFDLILVDLFLGPNYPVQFEEAEFLQKLSQTLSKNGIVIFNRLTTKTSNFVPEKFIDKLAKFFKIEKTLKVDFNRLIFCSRREKR